jgi:hypothetical protein
MSPPIFPEYVEAFIARTNEFLGSFDTKLTPSDEHQVARGYSVRTPRGIAGLLVYPTFRSTSEPGGEYRARAWITLPEGLADLFQSGDISEGAWNQYASLGALIKSEQGVEIRTQCLIRPDSIDVMSGTFAAAIIHATPSILEPIVKTIAASVQTNDASKEKVAQIDTLSAWSDLDFEQLHYDHAHLGVGKLMSREWRRSYYHRYELSLSAVHNHPYLGGGLLLFLRIPQADLLVDRKAVATNDLNKWESLFSDAPTFGGWCKDSDGCVFVSFAPNFLKGLPDFTNYLVQWATTRAHTMHSLVTQGTLATLQVRGI